MLMKEEGKFVRGFFGYNRFMTSLTNCEFSLEPGNYVVLVDPMWEECSSLDDGFRKILVQVFAHEKFALTRMDPDAGMQVLVEALKHCAQHLSPEKERSTYLVEYEGYGSNVYRLADFTTPVGRFGFIYTRNNSPYDLRETLQIEITG